MAWRCQLVLFWGKVFFWFIKSVFRPVRNLEKNKKSIEEVQEIAKLLNDLSSEVATAEKLLSECISYDTQELPDDIFGKKEDKDNKDSTPSDQDPDSENPAK